MLGNVLDQVAQFINYVGPSRFWFLFGITLWTTLGLVLYVWAKLVQRHIRKNAEYVESDIREGMRDINSVLLLDFLMSIAMAAAVVISRYMPHGDSRGGLALLFLFFVAFSVASKARLGSILENACLTKDSL